MKNVSIAIFALMVITMFSSCGSKKKRRRDVANEEKNASTTEIVSTNKAVKAQNSKKFSPKEITVTDFEYINDTFIIPVSSEEGNLMNGLLVRFELLAVDLSGNKAGGTCYSLVPKNLEEGIRVYGNSYNQKKFDNDIDYMGHIIWLHKRLKGWTSKSDLAVQFFVEANEKDSRKKEFEITQVLLGYGDE